MEDGNNAPKPHEILAARKAAGITQKKAGELLYTTYRVWAKWEKGERKMHKAFWELFKIKTKDLRVS
ncbi:MAG TPA: helix-turn-helix transcriptional regulator [Methylophilus sp.]|nr:helix-turn-helix transcriptional regulator [Methylophilus sp.]HQQ33374.1 helix-turn-helix transcriptional regulator [Methylophilus sp.]